MPDTADATPRGEQTPPSAAPRRVMLGGATTVWVALAVAIAILANLIAAQMTWRVDLTQQSIYTLSAPTTKTVRALDKPVVAKVFISADLPPPFHTLKERTRDLLSEYRAASGGTFSFEIITPRDGEDLDAAASQYGCAKVSLGKRTEDEALLRRVYKCVAFEQGGDQEVIENLLVTGDPAVDNLELDFTRALLNLTAETTRTIGFVAGFGGVAAQPEFTESVAPLFREAYGEVIQPVTVDLSDPSITLPDNLAGLVLLNLEQPLSPRASFVLDQFLQRGGAIAWFQSTTLPDAEAMFAQAQRAPDRAVPDLRKVIPADLANLLAPYGVAHNRDMIVDPASGMTVPVPTDGGRALVTNPAVFQVGQMNRRLTFLAGLPPLSLPTPASLRLTEVAKSADLKVQEALVTAPSARRLPGVPTTRSVQQLIERGQTPDALGQQGTYLLGVSIEGSFPSLYASEPLPPGVSEEMLYTGPTRRGRLLVIGSGDFFVPQPQLGYTAGLVQIGDQLLSNSFEWLAQDEILSEIRERRRPQFIGKLDRSSERSIHFINILFVPACFAAIGAVMMVRRRRRRERLAERFTSDGRGEDT